MIPCPIKSVAMLVLPLAIFQANATDMDPRSYSNIPVGLNFLIAGYTHTTGNISFAPSVPIENAKINIDSALLAFSRSLDIFGKSGKVDLILPGASLFGTADVLGQPRVLNGVQNFPGSRGKER